MELDPTFQSFLSKTTDEVENIIRDTMNEHPEFCEKHIQSNLITIIHEKLRNQYLSNEQLCRFQIEYGTNEQFFNCWHSVTWNATNVIVICNFVFFQRTEDEMKTTPWVYYVHVNYLQHAKLFGEVSDETTSLVSVT